MDAEIFRPVVVLAAWTMVMWLWMYATRIPAMTKAKVDPDSLVRQGGTKLDDILPAEVQWKAHNYNHLHEQPTIFYAVAILIGVEGAGNGYSATVAWAYVALRIVHSLVQATVNRVAIRFGIFVLASLALIALVVHAVMVVF